MSTRREFFANLPPPSECLAILVGCAELTIFGLAGLANPIEWAQGYGLPLTSASSQQKRGSASESDSEETKRADKAEKTQLALVSAIAARNVGNGVLILTLACYIRDRRALGIAIASNIVTTLADTLIVRWFGAKDKANAHVTGILNSILISASLLYWSRNDPWPWAGRLKA